MNRVQSQVLKNLVIVYVEVPPPPRDELVDGGVENVTALLKSYRVREIIVKRWTPNRSRD